MKRVLLLPAALIALMLAHLPLHAADAVVPEDGLILPASETTLAEHAWRKRPLIVFADSPNDPRFVQQMGNIAADPIPLIDRDVVVITDTDPDARTDIRQEMRPRGFMLVLLGKDGQKYLRKPFPWDVREITHSIDKMPLRQQEMRDASLRPAFAVQ